MAHQAINIGEYSVYLEETTSTNDALKLLMGKDNLPEGAMVYAAFQTAGRGQQGNVWEAEAGENLLCSILLKPQFLFADEQVWINVVLSLAVHDAAESLAKTPCKIKWPNDIYMGDKKIAGILTENTLQGNRIRYSIVGLGLNLNQQVFQTAKAASLMHFSGTPIDPKQARLLVSERLEHYYSLLKGKKFDLLWDLYHRHLLGKGQKALFQKNAETFEAEVMGIDKKGRLHLLKGEDVLSFAHKEIEFIQLI